MPEDACVFQITEYSVFYFLLTNQYATQCLSAKGKPYLKAAITLYGLSFQ